MLDADCSKLAGIDIEGTTGTRCRMLDTEEIALLGAAYGNAGTYE